MSEVLSRRYVLDTVVSSDDSLTATIACVATWALSAFVACARVAFSWPSALVDAEKLDLDIINTKKNEAMTSMTNPIEKLPAPFRGCLTAMVVRTMSLEHVVCVIYRR